jgi:hypothetical protein
MAFLIYALRWINQIANTTTSDILRLSIGTVDPRTLISSGEFPTDMASLALIANFPQLLLSLIYFTYNGLFTAMLLGWDWSSYACKRKGLRISRTPSGHQRSTYFLQLPYRFGFPLVVLSGTLHWLVSQSIFLVAFDIYDEHGMEVGEDSYEVGTRTCGFSTIAMLAVIILGFLMIVAVVGVGFIPYKHGMPLAGSCSLSISAACHPGQHVAAEDTILSEQELQWGVVSTSVDGVGHCAFSSKEVGPLVTGRTYA